MNELRFILYDGRACGDSDTDDVSVLVICSSMEEAYSYQGDYGDMVCYSYELTPDNELINEQWEWDYVPPIKESRKVELKKRCPICGKMKKNLIHHTRMVHATKGGDL